MSVRFCPLCGKPLRTFGTHPLVCSNGHEYYRNPKPCNAVILENPHGEILLLRRAAEPRKGYWDLPGGFVELGETLEESMLREMQEEVGFRTHRLRYVSSCPGRYQYHDENYHILTFLFYARTSRTRIIKTDEFSEARFFARHKIPLTKIAFPGLRAALKKFIKSNVEH